MRDNVPFMKQVVVKQYHFAIARWAWDAQLVFWDFPRRCLIGFRSGCWPGHLSTLILWDSSQLFTRFNVCLGRIVSIVEDSSSLHPFCSWRTVTSFFSRCFYTKQSPFFLLLFLGDLYQMTRTLPPHTRATIATTKLNRWMGVPAFVKGCGCSLDISRIFFPSH